MAALESTFPPDRNVLAANPRCGGGAKVVVDPLGEAKPSGWTRFVCFSDTRGLHDGIPAGSLPHADVLLHAGNFTKSGEPDQVQSFAEWLARYPASHKVVIAGNHDVTFEPDYYHYAWPRFHAEQFDCEDARRPVVSGQCCTYLEDETVEILGYRIYGSPWTLEFHDGAFNLRRGSSCHAAWDRIPPDADVLLSHAPPHGPAAPRPGGPSGGEELLAAVRRRGLPLSVAGHIPEGHGVSSDGTTLFVNAASSPSGPPVVLDLPPAEDFREAAGHGRRRAEGLLRLHAEISSNSWKVPKADATLADLL